MDGKAWPRSTATHLRVHHCLALHAGGLLEAISRSEWVSAARIRVWHVHALHWICVGLFKSCGRTCGTGRPVMTDALLYSSTAMLDGGRCAQVNLDQRRTCNPVQWTRMAAVLHIEAPHHETPWFAASVKKGLAVRRASLPASCAASMVSRKPRGKRRRGVAEPYFAMHMDRCRLVQTGWRRMQAMHVSPCVRVAVGLRQERVDRRFWPFGFPRRRCSSPQLTSPQPQPQPQPQLHLLRHHPQLSRLA